MWIAETKGKRKNGDLSIVMFHVKLEYKESHLPYQLEETHPLLREVARDFVLLSQFFGVTPLATRITDAVAQESGVHPDFRGIDFRDESPKGKFLYDHDAREKIVFLLNRKYLRRDSFPTVLWHDAGTGHHFHLQVAPLKESYENEKWKLYYYQRSWERKD